MYDGSADLSSFPFTAVVGSEDLALALVLTAVSPEVGGVLVRGEKGTAKSTMVRGLAAVLPPQPVVAGCRFGCAPVPAAGRAPYAVTDHPGSSAQCPDGPHDPLDDVATRPARLVELPIGATEDRVVGSLDLERALARGETSYQPGLLASANRGILYVDEVNLLHDHLVDLLLDAAAMGRNTVERDGVSVSHAARIVLVGTMNPEEGELRPQLLDRFGLTVEVAAPRDPDLRAEVVRRRLAFDADPSGFSREYAAAQAELRQRIARARARLADIVLPDSELTRIARVCSAFEVDGLRADIVTARAAVAHAAWCGRLTVTRADVRAAARLALPHRRRRNPFDSPGLDEDLLEEVLGDDEPEPEPEPDPAPSGVPEPSPGGGSHEVGDAPADPAPGAPTHHSTGPSTAEAAEPHRQTGQAPTVSVSVPEAPYGARLLTVKGLGAGEPGRRSAAVTRTGRRVGSSARPEGPVHLPATIRTAALHQPGPPSNQTRIVIRPQHLRRSFLRGRESNLVLLCVDASGSMAARRRMEAVKGAALSLLLDAYQRRDKVGLVTFRGDSADLVLPPTSSVDVAARRLEALAHGGRTPLAEGLQTAYDTLRTERLRDPTRRALLVVVTDARATAGPDALPRALRVAAALRHEGVDSVVVDCESGRFRLALASRLARELGAAYVPVGELAASAIVDVARVRRDSTTAMRKATRRVA